MWTNTYVGPGNSGDFVTATAVDSSGNVFVTGYSLNQSSFTSASYATVGYSTTGVPLWTNLYNGSTNDYSRGLAIAVDGSGNVVVAGKSYAGAGSNSFDTIKISSAGAPIWTNRQPVPGSVAGPCAVAVDASGKVFLATIAGLAAYSSGGALLWTNNDIAAAAAALDGGGNLIVTERTTIGLGPGGYRTTKFSNDGAPLWTNLYHDEVNGNATPKAIAVDSDGNVFVTGTSFTGTNYYFATVGYSAAGVPLWTNRYNRPGGSDDRAIAIAVDGRGNVFVTGQSCTKFNSTVFSDYRYATVAYASAGTPLWTNLYDGSSSGSESCAIAADTSGNVFVTGLSYLNEFGFTTVAYSAVGAPLWTNSYNSLSGANNTPVVAADRAGNVFVTGESGPGLVPGFHYTTLKYSSSIPARLDFQRVDAQLVLTWTNVGFNLQFAPSAAGTFTNIAGATSPYTHSLLGGAGYFRLQGS